MTFFVYSLQFPRQCSSLQTHSSQGEIQNRKRLIDTCSLNSSKHIYRCRHTHTLSLSRDTHSLAHVHICSSLPCTHTHTHTHTHAYSQLQSLVARTQCGDLLPVLNSLLEDRKQKRVGKEGVELASRSVYRETLFLKSVLANGYIDIGILP